jgi:hypothetical protein
MMPFCNYKGIFGRCNRVATKSIGKIGILAKDGHGNPFEQTHYLCDKHHHKLLKTLGLLGV